MCQEHFDEELLTRKDKIPTKSSNNMVNEIGRETTTVCDAVDIFATDATTPDKNIMVIASSLFPSATHSEPLDIELVTSDIGNLTISERPETRELPSSSSNIRNVLSTAAVTDNKNCTECRNCLLKDMLIENKNSQINISVVV